MVKGCRGRFGRAVILVLALIGISIYVLFFWIGKKWASWES